MNSICVDYPNCQVEARNIDGKHRIYIYKDSVLVGKSPLCAGEISDEDELQFIMFNDSRSWSSFKRDYDITCTKREFYRREYG